MKTLAQKIHGQQNALLAALSTAECERLANDLELVPLRLGQVLYEAGQTMSHAYFPIDCVVSLLYVMKNGESAEIAIVGNEGMIGIALFMGGESTLSRAIVQNAGHAYRLKAQVLKDEFSSGGALSVTVCRSEDHANGYKPPGATGSHPVVNTVPLDVIKSGSVAFKSNYHDGATDWKHARPRPRQGFEGNKCAGEGRANSLQRR